MRALKIHHGSSCWRSNMEPIPRWDGWLVEDEDTVRFFNLNVFAPTDACEVKAIDAIEQDPTTRNEIDYLMTSVPRCNAKRDCRMRKNYFNSAFMKGRNI